MTFKRFLVDHRVLMCVSRASITTWAECQKIGVGTNILPYWCAVGPVKITKQSTLTVCTVLHIVKQIFLSWYLKKKKQVISILTKKNFYMLGVNFLFKYEGQRSGFVTFLLILPGLRQNILLFNKWGKIFFYLRRSYKKCYI